MGETPLYQAVDMEKIEHVKLLLEKKSNPNIPQNDGLTPLHLAVIKKNIQIVQLLLSNGADPNAKTKYYDQTPVHLAIKNDVNPTILLLLVQYNGSLVLKDSEMKRPIDYANSDEMKETLKKLRLQKENIFRTPQKERAVSFGGTSRMSSVSRNKVTKLGDSGLKDLSVYSNTVLKDAGTAHFNFMELKPSNSACECDKGKKEEKIDMAALRKDLFSSSAQESFKKYDSCCLTEGNNELYHNGLNTSNKKRLVQSQFSYTTDKKLKYGQNYSPIKEMKEEEMRDSSKSYSIKKKLTNQAQEIASNINLKVNGFNSNDQSPSSVRNSLQVISYNDASENKENISPSKMNIQENLMLNNKSLHDNTSMNQQNNLYSINNENINQKYYVNNTEANYVNMKPIKEEKIEFELNNLNTYENSTFNSKGESENQRRTVQEKKSSQRPSSIIYMNTKSDINKTLPEQSTLYENNASDLFSNSEINNGTGGLYHNKINTGAFGIKQNYNSQTAKISHKSKASNNSVDIRQTGGFSSLTYNNNTKKSFTCRGTTSEKHQPSLSNRLNENFYCSNFANESASKTNRNSGIKTVNNNYYTNITYKEEKKSTGSQTQYKNDNNGIGNGNGNGTGNANSGIEINITTKQDTQIENTEINEGNRINFITQYEQFPQAQSQCYGFGKGGRYIIMNQNLQPVDGTKLYEWLREINLLCYYALFIEKGIFSLDKIILDLKDEKIKVRYTDIEELGIKKPGHIYRIITKLEIDAGIINQKIYKSIITEKEEMKNFLRMSNVKVAKNFCCGCNVSNEVMHEKANSLFELVAWLKDVSLLSLKENFLHNGFEMVEYFIMQMFSSCPIDEKILSEQLHIYSGEQRDIIIMQLNKDVKYLIRKINGRLHKSTEIQKEEETSCKMCTIF